MKFLSPTLRLRFIAAAGVLVVAVVLVGSMLNHEETATPVQARPNPPSLSAQVSTDAPEVGLATYYGLKYQGRPTASGEIFDMNQLTAAHPNLPFGTRVRVTNLSNNRSVIVRINDRGPFVKGRLIDLSQAAAQELQMVNAGVCRVKVEIVSPAGADKAAQ